MPPEIDLVNSPVKKHHAGLNMDSALRVKSQERRRRSGRSGPGDEIERLARQGGLGQAPLSVTASGAGLGVVTVDVDPFGL